MGFKPSVALSAPAPRPPAQQELVREDKWKLASQLQKAIRHGKLLEAEQATRDLWRIEPSYLRYRLSVIAVEDMAAGSPEVVIDAFEGGWKKAEIDARGGLDFLVATVSRYASATKDRTPCDLMYCTKFCDDFEQRHGPWKNMSWDTACRLAFDHDQPWWARALGAWRCAGTDKFQARTPFLADTPGDWDRWVQANQEAYGQDVARLMKIGENQREHHHVFIGLALGERDFTLLQPVLPDLPNIGPWLSASLDKHTAEGRRAITRMIHAHPSGAAALTQAGFPSSEHADLIGRMWFWLEGSRCDVERSHALSRAIRHDNRDRTMKGAPQSILLDAFGDPQRWQRARCEALGVRYAPQSKSFRV